MAILPSCPGLSVKVMIGSRALREYEDPNGRSGPTKVSKYIQSVTGLKFAVRVRFTAPSPTDQDVSVKISVDGKTILYDRVASNDLYQQGGYLHEGPIVKRHGQTLRQGLRFAAVESTDERAPLNLELEDKVARIGTITVQLQHCRNVRKADTQVAPPIGRAALGVVPESAMKADPRSHQAALLVSQAQHSQDLEDWDEVGDGPFAKFQFRYRSREFLEALHVAPRREVVREQPESPSSRQEPSQVTRTFKKRDAHGRQIGGAQHNFLLSSDDEDVDFVSSKPVRKHRRALHGASQEDPIDLDTISEDEGQMRIQRMVGTMPMTPLAGRRDNGRRRFRG